MPPGNLSFRKRQKQKHLFKMNVLVIDVGGTNVKMLATGQQESIKFPSGPAMTAKAMVAGVKKRTRDWKYDVISVGYPGPVLRGCPKAEPRNLAPGWVGLGLTPGLPESMLSP